MLSSALISDGRKRVTKEDEMRFWLRLSTGVMRGRGEIKSMTTNQISVNQRAHPGIPNSELLGRIRDQGGKVQRSSKRKDPGIKGHLDLIQRKGKSMFQHEDGDLAAQYFGLR